MVIQDLGVVTAYGYALAGGYTGTEEEFEELMATAIEVASRAVEYTDSNSNGNVVISYVAE